MVKASSEESMQMMPATSKVEKPPHQIGFVSASNFLEYPIPPPRPPLWQKSGLISPLVFLTTWHYLHLTNLNTNNNEEEENGDDDNNDEEVNGGGDDDNNNNNNNNNLQQ